MLTLKSIVMNNGPKDPRNKDRRQEGGNEAPEDQNAGRQGGDDALAERTETDSRADEKVIVNEQTQNKTVNAPSQTGVHSSEMEGSDEDVL